MSHETKDKLMAFGLKVLIGLLALFVVGCIGLSIYCLIKYGNLPPEDVPSWVHWLMWSK